MSLKLSGIDASLYGRQGQSSTGFGIFRPLTQPETRLPFGGTKTQGVEQTSSPYIQNRDLVARIGAINTERSPEIAGGGVANKLDYFA